MYVEVVDFDVVGFRPLRGEVAVVRLAAVAVGDCHDIAVAIALVALDEVALCFPGGFVADIYFGGFDGGLLVGRSDRTQKSNDSKEV